MKKILTSFSIIVGLLPAFFLFKSEEPVKVENKVFFYKDNSFFKLPFRQRAVKVLAQNSPTVIVEASMYSNRENIVDLKTTFDPILMLNSYQAGLVYSLYARPINVENDGSYSSTLLEKFSFEKKSNLLTLKLKEKLFYDNNEKIDAEELAFTILRVAYHRRGLSPFNQIKGFKKWLSKSCPLCSKPEGLKVIDSRTVEIHFSKKPYHPFYWLTFPAVSLVPKYFIDLKTGLLQTKRPPSSGLYKIDYITNNIVAMKRRFHKNNLPQSLSVIFLQNEDISNYINLIQENHVVELQEGFHLSGGFESKIKEKFRQTGSTENWLNLLVLDPSSEIFSKEEARQLLTYEMRKSLAYLGKKVTGSIIPEIGSGFSSLQSLENNYSIFDAKIRKKTLLHLRKHPIKISHNISGFLKRILLRTADRLKIKVIVERKVNLQFKRICLESLDVHHALKYVLLYSYKKQGIILPQVLEGKLRSLSKKSPKKNQDFNRSLFKSAIISPLMAYRRSQLIKKSSSLDFPEQFLRQDWHRFFEKDQPIVKKSHDERVIEVLKRKQATVINPWPTMPQIKPYTITRMSSAVLDPAELLRTDFHSVLYALYSRPLEVTESGDYRSQILKSFEYSRKDNKIFLRMKKNLSFSNGESMTAQDLAFTIARVAYLKPKLETFKTILGMKEWLESEEPLQTLPSGINILSPHKIEINFDSPRSHPFFWLSLSIFSVIPKTSFDPKTAKLLEQHPPFSGAYELISNIDDILVFRKRWKSRSLPDILNAIYPKNSFIKFLDYFSQNHLIDAQTALFFDETEKDKLAHFKVTGTIYNQSSGAFYDKSDKTFKKRRVRQFFNQELRKTIALNNRKAFGSMTPELSPGSVSLKELEKNIENFTTKEREEILLHLRKNPPRDYNGLRYNPLHFMYRVLKETCDRLKIPLVKSEKSNVRFFIMSFEPFDYPEYIKYTFAYGIPDRKITESLRQTLQTMSLERVDSIVRFNRTIFKEACIAPILSHGRFQIAHKNTILNLDEPVIKQGWLGFFEGIAS